MKKKQKTNAPNAIKKSNNHMHEDNFLLLQTAHNKLFVAVVLFRFRFFFGFHFSFGLLLSLSLISSLFQMNEINVMFHA